jgi:hypothetical protein
MTGIGPLLREWREARRLSQLALSSAAGVLERSEPNPTVIIDRCWNLLRANTPALWLCTGVDPVLLDPPANVVRLSLHDDGLRPRIANFDEYAGHLARRVRSAAVASRDPALAALADEVDDLVGASPGPAVRARAFASSERLPPPSSLRQRPVQQFLESPTQRGPIWSRGADLGQPVTRPVS